jgi:glycosyltransferase involved in cell wall biosynthesis
MSDQTLELTVCWFGIYNKRYSRNDILFNGLTENGVKIIECQADAKAKNRYSELWNKLRALKNSYDVIYAAYPAPVATILAKIISKKPVVMDAFYPMFDAVVNDRAEIPWFHPKAIKLFFFDWLSAIVADYMIVDTLEHKKYWQRFPFVKQSKIHPIYIGFNDKIFFPIESAAQKKFIVSFHGTFIPLQGIPKIIEAARILKDDHDIQFVIIGNGQENEKVIKLIQKYDLKNIEKIERIDQSLINAHINKADVILGIFGDTPKAARVIPNKLYEGMAVRKAVITMDTPAIREVFSKDELMIVPGNPEAIAAAIVKLKNHDILRKQLAENGYKRVKDEFSQKPLGKKLREFLESIQSHEKNISHKY